MTALRQSAMRELEKLPEDKVSFILQILQEVNDLYNDNHSKRKDAANIVSVCVDGTI